MLSQDEIKYLFDYKDGNLFWKHNHRARKVKGQKAGWFNDLGYVCICIRSKQYKLHRLVWTYHNGYLPEGSFLDHINGNPKDNRIENLRLATPHQNQCNSKKRIDNTSGVKGVHWDRVTGKWKTQLSIGGKRKCFGSFYDLELAELVINEAREKYHKLYANYGK